MMLVSRVRQLERRFVSKNWTDALTDDELEAALAAVTVSIARRTDVSGEELAGILEPKLAHDEITDQGDRKLARQYIVRSEALPDRGAPEIGTLFRAAALCFRLDGLANPDDFVMTDDPFADLMAHIAAHGQRSIVRRADAE